MSKMKPTRDMSKGKGLGNFLDDLPTAKSKPDKTVRTASRPAVPKVYKLTLKVQQPTNDTLEEAVLLMKKRGVKPGIATKAAIISLTLDLAKKDILAGKYDDRMEGYSNRAR